ncbi:TIGR01244 family sulfur transferase [uncultured Tateyamaria sp.]|uniref:TIGR01244 family sulfur transferase n=1 Tax=uncultured Tateyamaria sp. TaxID=455651 RepID=UPI00262A5C3A|nr:TIGR01244 family sulfur transferase [uncultured Tateyamaria sp.]
MDMKKITDVLTVSPQIHLADMAAIKAACFKTIIYNGPDGEGTDQPGFAEIAAAAEAAGLEACTIPVTSGQIIDDDVTAFATALQDGPHPLLAYCRTGTRLAMLWAFHVACTHATSDILIATAAAGYDLGDVADRIANGGKVPALG